MTIPQIAYALGTRLAEIAVRSEGWRLEQVADYLAQNTPLDGAEYRQRHPGACSRIDTASYDFLALRPPESDAGGLPVSRHLPPARG